MIGRCDRSTCLLPTYTKTSVAISARQCTVQTLTPYLFLCCGGDDELCWSWLCNAAHVLPSGNEHSSQNVANIDVTPNSSSMDPAMLEHVVALQQGFGVNLHNSNSILSSNLWCSLPSISLVPSLSFSCFVTPLLYCKLWATRELDERLGMRVTLGITTNWRWHGYN